MTAKQINNMSADELAHLAEGLTTEENLLWAFWGYDGRTYELIMHDRQNKIKVAKYKEELEGTLV